MHSPEEGTRVDRGKGKSEREKGKREEERKGNLNTQFGSQTNVSTGSTKKGKCLEIVSEGEKVSKKEKV